MALARDASRQVGVKRHLSGLWPQFHLNTQIPLRTSTALHDKSKFCWEPSLHRHMKWSDHRKAWQLRRSCSCPVFFQFGISQRGRMKNDSKPKEFGCSRECPLLVLEQLESSPTRTWSQDRMPMQGALPAR